MYYVAERLALYLLLSVYWIMIWFCSLADQLALAAAATIAAAAAAFYNSITAAYLASTDPRRDKAIVII